MMAGTKKRLYLFLFTLFLCCILFGAAEIFSFYFLDYADNKNGLLPIKPGKRESTFAWKSNPFFFTGAAYNRYMGWDSLAGPVRNPDAKIDNIFVSSYGDSFTYCAELPADQTWEACVSNQNKKRFLNLGVRGYGPDQAFVKMKRYYDLFSSDIVVLGVLPEASRKVLSRVRNYYFSDPCRPVCKTRFLSEESYLKNTRPSGNYEFIDGFDLPVDDRLIISPRGPKIKLEALPYSFFTDPEKKDKAVSYKRILDEDYLKSVSLSDSWYDRVKQRYGLDLVTGRTFPYTLELIRYIRGAIKYPVFVSGKDDPFHWQHIYSEAPDTVSPKSEAFLIVRTLFLNFYRLSCKKRFIPVIMHHCHRTEIETGQPYIEKFEDWLTEKGISIINVQKILKPEIIKGHIMPADLFLKGNGHYTYLTNQVLASKLAPWFEHLSKQYKRFPAWARYKEGLTKHRKRASKFDFEKIEPDYKKIYFNCAFDALVRDDFKACDHFLSSLGRYVSIPSFTPAADIKTIESMMKIKNSIFYDTDSEIHKDVDKILSSAFPWLKSSSAETAELKKLLKKEKECSDKREKARIQAQRAWLLLTVSDSSGLRRNSRALELAAKSAAVLDYARPEVNLVMALAYYRLGRFSEAAETAETTIDIMTGHEDDHLHEMLSSLKNRSLERLIDEGAETFKEEDISLKKLRESFRIKKVIFDPDSSAEFSSPLKVLF
jgi:hypothetical protein